jgi:hypothetical protein
MPVPTMLDVDDGLYLLLTERDLGLLQLSTVLYYLHESNPDNGLVRDKTDPKAPVSIAAVGMALATIPGVVERGVLFRDFAAKITLKRLRYLRECPQGPNRMRPATKASSVISWTSRPAAASGSASSPPSTRRSCSVRGRILPGFGGLCTHGLLHRRRRCPARARLRQMAV